ncbi:MAG: hypothetical protein ABI904_00855 [Chloroflexota bacterium]
MNTDEKNTIVKVMNWIVDTLARTLVVLFDGIKNAVDHANPSLFALVATLLPFALPLPVAFMTAHSAQKFFHWEMWAANVLGYGLEGLGLLAWVKLVDAVLDRVKSNNTKINSVIALYAGVSLVYEVLLIFVNVVLAKQDGAGNDFVIVLTCICLLPALSALTYGYQRQAVEHQLEQERKQADERAEKMRQEKRQDRKEAQALKMQMQYGKDVPAVKLEEQPTQGAKFPRKK